ncbi:MAG TPA: hypothetical protein VFM54_05230 [Micromonosporaceae bacterium]|nr:hypothetical protein [Micromonosporaceae bacterium]
MEKTTATLAGALAKVTYDYDFTRLTKINYPAFPGNNVTYTYGPAGATVNRAGRITLVTDGSGSKQLSYGKLGETTREVRTSGCSCSTATGCGPASPTAPTTAGWRASPRPRARGNIRTCATATTRWAT